MTATLYSRSIPKSLGEVSPDCLEYLLQHARSLECAKNTVLVEHGAPCEFTYIVNKGLFVVDHPDAPGQVRMAPSRFVRRGQVVPPTLCPMDKACYEVRAVTQGRVTQLPCATLWAACQEWPEMALGLLASSVARGVQEYQLRARRATASFDEYIATLLWALSDPPDSHGARLLPYKIPQSLLARYFGRSREELSRHLSLFEKTGLIKKLSEGYLLFKEFEPTFDIDPRPGEPQEFLGSKLVSCPQTEELILRTALTKPMQTCS
jgi:CRP-like cAMP-binding protein